MENDSISRIAAQIVTGIGFLGAGAIMNDRGGIHGLTTAATIWLVAGIGASVGYPVGDSQPGVHRRWAGRCQKGAGGKSPAVALSSQYCHVDDLRLLHAPVFHRPSGSWHVHLVVPDPGS